MDEAGVFRKDIIRQFFELGLMGIEIPEEYGGQGGSFFQCVLAVEELSAVDPSAGVIVDVQNTIVNNAHPALGERRSRSSATCRAWPPTRWRRTRSRKPARAPTPSPWPRAPWTTATTSCSPAASCGSPTPPKPASSCCSPTPIPRPAIAASRRFWSSATFPGFQVGKKEDKLGLRASSTCELILDNCRVPRENVLGEVGKGYKIAIETLNEGRIAIGAQMIGLARGALDHAVAYAKQRKQFGKTIGEFQGVQFELAQNGDRSGSRAPAGLQRRAAARRRACRSSPKRPWRSISARRSPRRWRRKAIEVFGGVGITKDYPVEKLYRDAKIGRIYEGTSNIQLVTIAKKLLGGSKCV